jgi:dTDP-4-dehydrorhamnose reductase
MRPGRILITGAGGQLGRDLQRIFTGYDVVALDHRGLDIADRTAVFRKVEADKPSWIINAAAFNDVDRAEEEAEAAFAVNAAAPGYLAEASTRVGARLVHVSTDYVFDGRKGEPYTEDDRPNPLSAYGRSKLEGERRVLEASSTACVLRTAWLYSRHGSNFPRAIQQAAERGAPLKVVADQFGSPTATADLAGAIAELLERPSAGLFHVVNEGCCSRYQLARAIAGEGIPVEPISSAEARRPAPRPANSCLRSVRWEAAGLTPLRHWRDALREFLRG